MHDIIPWIMPEYREKLKSVIYLGIVGRTLKRAARIIAVSQETKKDVSVNFKIPKSLIFVTRLAPSESFFKKTATLHSTLSTRPFILYAE